MKHTRISATQEKVILCLVSRLRAGNDNYMKAATIKRFIDSNSLYVLNNANYLKGIHTLCKNGVLDVVRASDMSIHVKLTTEGVRVGARLYKKNTGMDLLIKTTRPEANQLDLVSFIENN